MAPIEGGLGKDALDDEIASAIEEAIADVVRPVGLYGLEIDEETLVDIEDGKTLDDVRRYVRPDKVISGTFRARPSDTMRFHHFAASSGAF